MVWYCIDLCRSSKASQTSFTEKWWPEQLYAYRCAISRKLLEAYGPNKSGSCQCFNLENKALRPIEILLSTEYMWILIFWWEYYFMIRWQVSQSKKWIFKNDATPGVQASISALNVIQKKNEVTINWTAQSKKKSNTKETVSWRGLHQHSKDYFV
jgi:hypothetical protein